MKHEVRVICRKCDEAQIVYCHYKHMRELTDEQIKELAHQHRWNGDVEFAKAILRKAQER